MNSKRIAPKPQGLEKMPTGIDGFDKITGGGLPRKRTSLVIGGPGTGKTVFAMQTLVNGVHRWNEPGIFVSFEENSRQIITNAASFDWDLETMEKEGRLFFLDAHLSADDIKSGKFDLVGMLASIKAKSDEMGAKRIVFDSIDVLLTFLNDPVTERQEIYRLHEWLAQEGPTGIITIRLAGDELLLSQHYGFMQFMTDCVVLLRHYLFERVSLRDLRIVKYRGSKIEENEFPLIIDSQGIDITSFGSKETKGEVSNERVSSGIERLDTMLNGGFFRGSNMLITGAPGTAKSTLCSAFAEAACLRREKTIYISFDESAGELVRNMSSVSIHLAPHIESGVLCIYSESSESRSSEEHLVRIKKLIREQKPSCLVIDPLSAMIRAGGRISALGVAKELLTLTNANLITTVLSDLVEEGGSLIEATGVAISTVTDTWINLHFLAQSGERNRALSIIKSRGSKHSNQVRELILSDEGITLTDVYTAGGEVLMGSLRWQKEHEEILEREIVSTEIKIKQREMEVSEAETLASMEILRLKLEAQRIKIALLNSQQKEQEKRWEKKQSDMGEMRGADKES